MFQGKPIIFLLGAGASIPVGIPGMRQMAQDFQETLKATSSTHYAILELLRTMGVSSDLEDILEACNDIHVLPGSPLGAFVDKCLSKRAAPKKVRAFHKQRDDLIDDVQAFREWLTQWLRRRCLHYDLEKAVHIYGELLSWIAQREIPLFTTNYDSVLDRVAQTVDLQISDNFQLDNYGRSFWDDSLASFDSNGVRLVRIHGSTEWYQDPEGRIEKIAVPTDVNPEGQPLSGLMIFPTRFKDIYLQPYFPLYSAFSNALAGAMYLFVIGHSLRDEYILAAIRERLRDERFSLIMIDPELPNPDELLRGNSTAARRIIHIPSSIETTFPNVVRALQILCRPASPTDEKMPDEEMRAELTSVVKSINDGKRDAISFKEPWKWHFSPGESRKMTLVIDTIHGGGRVVGWLKKDQRDKIPIRISPKQRGEKLEVYGRVTREIPVEIELPSELRPGSKHDFLLDVEYPSGAVKNFLSYTIHVLKHPGR